MRQRWPSKMVWWEWLVMLSSWSYSDDIRFKEACGERESLRVERRKKRRLLEYSLITFVFQIFICRYENKLFILFYMIRSKGRIVHFFILTYDDLTTCIKFLFSKNNFVLSTICSSVESIVPTITFIVDDKL